MGDVVNVLFAKFKVGIELAEEKVHDTLVVFCRRSHEYLGRNGVVVLPFGEERHGDAYAFVGEALGPDGPRV